MAPIPPQNDLDSFVIITPRFINLSTFIKKILLKNFY
jgi:hypothetical protein